MANVLVPKHSIEQCNTLKSKVIFNLTTGTELPNKSIWMRTWHEFFRKTWILN